MKLSRRHLEQALVLALDELAEQNIAVAELADRWRQARDTLEVERKQHKATRDLLDKERETHRATRAQLEAMLRRATTRREDPIAPCPHCPDGHGSPARCAWGVRVAPDVDADGQPTHLIVMPANGAHVAQADADWLWSLIRGGAQ